MSRLLLVRHGQASLFGDNYDRLSELGEEQSRQLGTFWAKRGTRIHQAFSGPRERQRRTAEIAGEAFAQAGGEWPGVQVVDDLDEYRIDLESQLPALAAEHAELAKAVGAIANASSSRDRARQFQKAVEVALTLWQGGQLAGDNVESWDGFCSRVASAVATVTASPGRSMTVAAFSSAGTIGFATGQLLGAPGRALLELSWAMSNCSVTEVLFSGERRSLSRFNAVGHLEDRLHSYR